LRRRRSGLHVGDLALQQFDLAFESVGWGEARQLGLDLPLPLLGVALVALAQVRGEQSDAGLELADLRRLRSQGSLCLLGLTAGLGGLTAALGEASLDLALSSIRFRLRS
jgi:hypothetical protein